jgi:hypothetical protein
MTKFIFETNITSLPAINYFAFFKHYRLFDAAGNNIFQESVAIKNQVIKLLRSKDKPENIILKLENSKIGLADSLNANARALWALACLCTKIEFEGKLMSSNLNAANDEEVNELGLQIYEELNIPYFELITEIGLVYQKLQRQLTKAYPECFKIDNAPFTAVQDAIRRMNVEDENSLLTELQNIQNVFLLAEQTTDLLGESANFEETYWAELLGLANNLGFTQEQLQKNSIAMFYASLQNAKNKNKQMESTTV